MNKMKNRLLRNISTGVIVVSAVILMAGCENGVKININTDPSDSDKSSDADVTINFDTNSETTADAESGDQFYTSKEGWSVQYDPSVITVNEADDFTSFVYTGESAGTNMLSVSYYKDAQPIEAIDELSSAWGDEDSIQKSESYFPGTTDKWGYWRSMISDGSEGSGLSENAFAGEYNGGTLMFEFTLHNGNDEEQNRAVNSVLMGIMDSITYDDFEPQTMYEGIPGKYVRQETEEIEGEEMSYEYSITLNEDHSGEISMQDDIYVMWGTEWLVQADNSYEYKIEGDTLEVNFDGMWLDFTKEEAGAEDKASDTASVLPAYEYTGNDELEEAVYNYINDEYSKNYEKADVSIPCVIIIDTDESDTEDIRVWGDFWFMNYDLEGENLMLVSGGDYPGCIHLRQTDSGYEVIGMEVTEDGSGNTESAKKIFGDKFDDYRNMTADTDKREKVRGRIIADYVKANNLDITAYQDYGWDPVELPK